MPWRQPHSIHEGRFMSVSIAARGSVPNSGTARSESGIGPAPVYRPSAGRAVPGATRDRSQEAAGIRRPLFNFVRFFR